MARRLRLWWTGGLTALFAFASSYGAAQTQQTSAPRAVLNQYCVVCHNQKANAGGLALDTLDAGDVGANPQIWEKVVRKLRVRMMPPPGAPRPDETAYDAVVSYLESSLDRVAAANPDPGRTDTFRRLSRTEYRNAIRDLLALDVDVASLLPKDDSSHGFDNGGLSGFSPTLLERYLAAAQKISHLAVGAPVGAPGVTVVVLPADLTQEDHVDGLPLGTRGGTVVPFTFPVDGEYEIQVRLMRNRNENVEGLTEAHQMEISLDGARAEQFTVAPKRSTPPGGTYYNDQEADTHLKTRIRVAAGPHMVGATFLKKTSALLETERQPYAAHFNMDRHPRTQPAVYSVSIGGPYDATGSGDTPSRRRLFVCRPANPSNPSDEERCAAAILSTLARRAYRRPVTAEDLRVPLAFYKDARSEGDFEAGIEMAVRAILTSAEFLFRMGMNPALWIPKEDGKMTELSPSLASLLPFLDHVTVVTNTELKDMTYPTGNHAASNAIFLSNVRPKRTEGSDVELAITVDQIAARQLGKETAIPSLELSTELIAQVGNCDNGLACAYQNNLAWSSPTTPLPAEADPRVLFERLFGNGGSAQDRRSELRKNKSILDWVTDDMARLQGQLGSGDRTTVNNYLDAIREVERRIQKAEERSAEVPLPQLDRPASVPAAWEDHVKLMFDLQVLALQADVTRVITFQMAREASTRTYPQIGVPEAHHPVSHHTNDPAKLAKLAKINAYHVSLFPYLAGKLKSAADGDGTLLDHTTYLLGSGMGNPDVHDHTNLPAVVVGGKGGLHIRYARPKPLANLHLTLLERTGVHRDTFADSDGRIEDLL